MFAASLMGIMFLKCVKSSLAKDLWARAGFALILFECNSLIFICSTKKYLGSRFIISDKLSASIAEGFLFSSIILITAEIAFEGCDIDLGTTEYWAKHFVCPFPLPSENDGERWQIRRQTMSCNGKQVVL